MAPTEPPPRRPVVASPEGMALATDIDRRHNKRVVPLKILCLGLSRTGTSSLRQALLDLGYSDVYHYASVLNENPRDAELWCEALEAKFAGKGRQFRKQEWDALTGHCMAISDTPSVMFYRELLATYPDAKVILTLRDTPEQWWRSQIRTTTDFIVKVCLPPQTPWTMFVSLFLPDGGAVGRMGTLLGQYAPMYQALVRDYRNGTRDGVQFYEEYTEEVKRIVPKERLLVMNVRQGWKPLCDFLGHEAPAWDFPNVNSGDDLLRNTTFIMGMMAKAAYWNMAKTLIPLASVAVAGLAWWLRSRR